MLKVHLRVLKRDQFCKGVDVYVGRTGTPLCLAMAVVTYMAACGQRPSPFFLWSEGRLLTKPLFVTEVRRGLAVAGLDQALFSGHSFRIGAITTTAQAGIPDSANQMLGR